MKFILFFLIGFSIYGSSSAKDILNYAKLAQAAYDFSDTFVPQIAEHNNPSLGNRLRAFYDIQKDQDRIYIVVRGSDALQNWIANLHSGTQDYFLKSLIPNTFVHIYEKISDFSSEWFFAAFYDLEQVSKKIILAYPNAKIIFIGHSYGGLMAHLLAQKFYSKNRPMECHTFNAPGSAEIRANTLQLNNLPRHTLKKYFFNHIRTLDPVSLINTHEGQIIKYPGSSHQIQDFIDYLNQGISN